MKKTLKNILTAVTLGASALGLASKVQADTPIMSFSELCYKGTGTSKTLQNYLAPDKSFGDNITYITDPNDPSGASDVVVSKEGNMNPNYNWNGEKWDAGFMKYLPEGGILFGAFASNDNFRSNYYPNFGGWVQGKMYDCVFGEGEKPDDLILMHDVKGDGIGNVVDGVSYLDWVNNQMYLYPDLIINGKRGDTSELPKFNGYVAGALSLPHMTVSPYAEISAENRGAKAIYLNGLREGTSGPLDLIAMTENLWTEGHGEHDYWASGADWNTDGKVDMQDFAKMSSVWSPENYLEWKPQTIFGAYPIEDGGEE